MIFVRIEGSNGVRWEKRVAEEQHIEKRQLGLIGGATSLLGGLLGIGNQPSTTAQPPPQTTRAPTVAPPVAAPPATTAPAVQPPATTAQPPPAVAPVPVSRSPNSNSSLPILDDSRMKTHSFLTANHHSAGRSTTSNHCPAGCCSSSINGTNRYPSRIKQTILTILHRNGTYSGPL